MSSIATRLSVAALLGLLASSCSPPEDPRAGLDPEALGELLFVEEEFEGNGRTCATCHILENFGTMTPEIIEATWAQDPDAPLFRAIDSDDGLGESYERLRREATVRVPIQLPVIEEIGLAVRRCDAPAETMVWLNRGNPSVFNIALEQNLMMDGRDGADLNAQAHNAIHTHAEPGREPTMEELTAIAAFQRTLYSSEAIQRFMERGDELELPEGRTPAEIRGREFFNEDRQCGVCHSGPMLNRTSAAHPDGEGMLFETALVGMNPDNPNPKYFWCWVDPETDEVTLGPNQDIMATWGATSDPGIGLQPLRYPLFPDKDGKRQRMLGVEAIEGIPSFWRIPTLWGTPQTAPYFHDNFAKTLDQVMEHYNLTFANLPDAFVIGCEPRTDECLDEQDRADIIAYMQLLSFDAVLDQLGGIPEPSVQAEAQQE